MSGKNVGDVARGLKGAVNNPNNSEGAKQSAQERLNQLEESGEINSQAAHDGQVLRGHKARCHEQPQEFSGGKGPLEADHRGFGCLRGVEAAGSFSLESCDFCN
ncbi:hypothetical protein NLI96_g2806 [Meripilus lineatus]|uniref:Conidiation-specific protein 6 n=1 Tax=Meripilus lineatus TaxID=2056292 RepID=A0AAD5YLH9_9APHY|nr:hypothetical protein NLI96_g2806 [Physisporinus lineatus]